MRAFCNHITLFVALGLLMSLAPTRSTQAQSRYGVNDTIITPAVVYEGDTIEAQTLPGIYVWGKYRYLGSSRRQ
ncbi:MAG: hypothetical protein KGM98_05320, partial [Bacteroidota bacterium]|nr:hypothetical protein [Bacteroidota bacterium]